MKKGVLKFTACCMAVGMTVSGTGLVAFASKGVTLAGFGAVVSGENTETAAETTENTEAASETEAVENTEAALETVEGTEATELETSAPETEAVQETEPTLDTSMNGEMAFAQCDEYINVRTDASTDSEVVGKVYNNGSVTILGQMGDWYQVQSGNAVGYVKAEYFATGEEAQAIAEDVAYNVATVYAEALTVRSEASEDSEPIGTVYSTDELEVVQYEGDWMKVALGNDVYGYVNAYYVGYDTYYATAETLEEEQARLDQEWLDYLAEQEAKEAAAEQAYLAQLAAEEAAAAQAAADAAYQEQIAASQAAAEQAAADAAYQQQAAAEAEAAAAQQAQATSDAQAAAEQAYQEYLDAQATADAATQTADEQAVIDTAAQAQAEYAEYLAAQAAADAQAQAEADAAAQAQAEAEAAAAAQAEADAAAQAQAEADAQAQAAAEAAAQAQAEADAAAQAQAEADAAAQAEADAAAQAAAAEETQSSSTLGQQIVNFAVQFVGNPYVWGGTSLTGGADCSGFTQSVFANFGISIPRTAAAQSGSGTPVDLGSIQAGDLLFYSGDSGIGHVTIYMGNGQVVHASNSNTGIIISDYGYRTPVSARRYW